MTEYLNDKTDTCTIRHKIWFIDYQTICDLTWNDTYSKGDEVLGVVMYLPVIFYGDRWKITDSKMDAIHLKIQLTFGVLG